MFDTSSSRTTVAVGYGLLPAGTSAGEPERTLRIVAEVDGRTHKIVDASFTMLTETSQRWLKQFVVGLDLTSEADAQRFKAGMQRWFFGNSRQTIVDAYGDMAQRYAARAGILQPQA
jgi:hypothetical protein